MIPFFRFPHTPHIAWLGEGEPRDDKVMAPEEAAAFLDGEITVEEKIDGANVGFSVDGEGDFRVQNRGAYLDPEACHLQFKPLFRWLAPRRDAIADALFPDLMLFGEWCHAVHSVRYSRLPDWFLAFDVYDRAAGAFWSVARRDALFAGLGLAQVPKVAAGRFDLAGVTALLRDSRFADVPAEGVYLRRDAGDLLLRRAKLVRPAFIQQIGEHWSKRAMEMNGIVE